MQINQLVGNVPSNFCGVRRGCMGSNLQMGRAVNSNRKSKKFLDSNPNRYFFKNSNRYLLKNSNRNCFSIRIEVLFQSTE